MKLGIIGARNFDNRAFVDAAIRRASQKNPDLTLLVSNFSWVGAWARMEGGRHRVASVEFKTTDNDWFGWMQVHRRLVEECDALIVFWDGSCRVTAQSAVFAQRQGKVLRVYRVTPKRPEPSR